ncbi:hypothetical protein RvY_08370 [Ramazzottius varieornatus]|uniref:Uncharacterized protein n=1 Tax=Ramazzottius varieornatus TaxID=947166 RepID=A0A1D1V5K4_RAMVA|nr:hypothetical protein RvY_08370 [Ramazzottius varieornatus]
MHGWGSRGRTTVSDRDYFDDYQTAVFLWCRFAFVNKPPSQGRYPYYPTCHLRDMTTHFFCFEPQNASETINTFITAMWDNEANFYVYRRVGPASFLIDTIQPYKCCKTPPVKDITLTKFRATTFLLTICALNTMTPPSTTWSTARKLTRLLPFPRGGSNNER